MPEPIKNPAPAPHGNQRADLPRVRLCGGPFMDAHCIAQMIEWQKRGASYGEILDRMVINAQRTGFDPVTDSFVKQTKSKETKNRPTPKG